MAVKAGPAVPPWAAASLARSLEPYVVQVPKCEVAGTLPLHEQATQVAESPMVPGATEAAGTTKTTEDNEDDPPLQAAETSPLPGAAQAAGDPPPPLVAWAGMTVLGEFDAPDGHYKVILTPQGPQTLKCHHDANNAGSVVLPGDSVSQLQGRGSGSGPPSTQDDVSKFEEAKKLVASMSEAERKRL